jgi:hypothetical protein
MRYAANEIAHWRNPELITAGMNAPAGVNVMWNPSLLAPGIALSLVTLLAGPQVSLTVMLTAGFAGSATALLWVLRRWSCALVPAALGGFACKAGLPARALPGRPARGAVRRVRRRHRLARASRLTRYAKLHGCLNSQSCASPAPSRGCTC